VIDEKSTLADVCFEVSAALETHGMTGVLTGGSAAALYAPQAYMSDDADFVLDADHSLDEIAIALETIGYDRDGRSRVFVHPKSKFTVDFPKGPLAVGGEYVRETDTIARGPLRLRILTPEDCMRDRLAHFYYWNDYTALNAAVGVARSVAAQDLAALRSWTERESPNFLEKFAEFERRVRQER
jgi:hypothetical protein